MTPSCVLMAASSTRNSGQPLHDLTGGNIWVSYARQRGVGLTGL
jgi:hypothetical protein